MASKLPCGTHRSGNVFSGRRTGRRLTQTTKYVVDHDSRAPCSGLHLERELGCTVICGENVKVGCLNVTISERDAFHGNSKVQLISSNSSSLRLHEQHPRYSTLTHTSRVMSDVASRGDLHTRAANPIRSTHDLCQNSRLASSKTSLLSCRIQKLQDRKAAAHAPARQCIGNERQGCSRRALIEAHRFVSSKEKNWASDLPSGCSSLDSGRFGLLKTTPVRPGDGDVHYCVR